MLSLGAGVTAYAAVRSLDLKAGQWLAVVGCGGLGHLAIQFAKTMGIKTVGREYRFHHPVFCSHLLLEYIPSEPLRLGSPRSGQLRSIIVDIRDSALALAKKVGADATVDCTKATSAIEEVRKMTEQGVHGAILLADSQGAMELAAEVTRKHGTVCLVAAVSHNLYD